MLIRSVASLVVAFALSAWLTARFSRPGSALYVLDQPNARSLHTRPTPRSGGIAIVVAALVAGLIEGTVIDLWLVLSAGLIAMVSFLDDRFALSPTTRLSVQVLAAVLLIVSGTTLDSFQLPGIHQELPFGLGVGVTLLFAVWMANLYNFMDGMDGFAGGMAVVGFGAFCLLGLEAGAPEFAVSAAIIALATGGFLIFNFPPAKIFMGDTGSSTLGFLAAGLALYADQRQLFPLWISWLVFSPFIVDATVTLVRRALKGERVWNAHRTHYYQRLVQLGWGHRPVVLGEYILMVACAVSAVVVWESAVWLQWMVILFWGLCYLALIALVHRAEAMATGTRDNITKGGRTTK